MGDALVLVRRLGRGAMGEVWLARHEKLKHELAIKFLQGDGVGGTLATQQLERFQFEGQVAARLAGLSRHIVAIHDAGQTKDGEPYLVMEYVRGTTLETWLDERGPLPPEHVAAIVDQVAEVLEIAHERGVLHRDLKPANVMLLGDSAGPPDVKVADFGVAKMLARDHDLDAPTPTHEGFLVGSPAYMSPEQLTGAKEPGPEADLWALSVMAYEALTGWAPFSGNSLSELTVAICKKPHERIAVHDAGLPRGLDDFFERTLAKRVGDRFGDATELAAAFRRALETPSTRPIAPSPPHRRLRPILALASIGIAVGIGAIVWRATRSDDNPRALPTEARPSPATAGSSVPREASRAATTAPATKAPGTTEPTAPPAPETPPLVEKSGGARPSSPSAPSVAPPPVPQPEPTPTSTPPPPAPSSTATAKPFDESETL